MTLAEMGLPATAGSGKYQLLTRLGQGGMAEVWKARLNGPGGFQRTVVIKRILPHLAADPNFVNMFMSEARLSARLSHGNIVQVFEFGEENGEHFLAMEFVHGRDLASIIREHRPQGPLPPGLCAYVVREVCRALAYAHSLTDDDGRPLRLIHRDISPSNVMIGFDGSVKLLDFGIAKALSESGDGTQTGTLKGKFGYMAPEQLEGQAFDHRADLFAVGVVLHEMLTGKRLFKGGTDFQTIANVKSMKVEPPSTLNPAVSGPLDAVCLKALERPREARFQTGQECAQALDEIVHTDRWGPEATTTLMNELFPDITGIPGAERAAEATRVGRHSGETAMRSHIHLGALVELTRIRRVAAVSAGALVGVGLMLFILLRHSAAPPIATPVANAAPPPPAAAIAQPVSVRIITVPAGAEVYAGDEPRGKTPLDFTLPRGPSHKLKLVAAGYQPAMAEASGSADTQIQMVLVPLPKPRPVEVRRPPPAPRKKVAAHAPELADPFAAHQPKR
jgi:eukaryotic-like serine/threonine-protein kinase